MSALKAVAIGSCIMCITGMTYASTYGTKICNSPGFYCYQVNSGDSWESLFGQSSQKEVVMKLNRMNVRLRPGMVIAIPRNNAASIMDITPFQRQINPPGEKVIMVNLEQLAWGAYDAQGNLLNWGPASGGQAYCSDLKRGCRSPAGKFTVYEKGDGGCVSTKFPLGRGGAPIPYCMFFHKGFALHGSYDVPGYNASHGCVRMFINDARWLNEEFVGEMKVPIILRR